MIQAFLFLRLKNSPEVCKLSNLILEHGPFILFFNILDEVMFVLLKTVTKNSRIPFNPLVSYVVSCLSLPSLVAMEIRHRM